jgi:L-lactate dehydrogenase (cytochrome)
VRFTLSTMSICSLEDVRAAVEGPFWFQLYLLRDRGFNEALISRAKDAHCSALMLTLDLPIQALRRRDAKNGLAVPPRLTARTAWEFLSHPAWLYGFLRGRRRTFGNLQDFFPRQGAATLAEWSNAQLDATITWKDVAWVRERWPGKLILKGILDAEDARHAATAGVDAVVVSNHGGRQLDGAPATLDALPEVVEAVDGRVEVLVDGGVRRGADVARALALGAQAVLAGRAPLWGLAARGEQGARTVLELLREEIELALVLLGCPSPAAVTRAHVSPRRAGDSAAHRPPS